MFDCADCVHASSMLGPYFLIINWLMQLALPCLGPGKRDGRLVCQLYITIAVLRLNDPDPDITVQIIQDSIRYS